MTEMKQNEHNLGNLIKEDTLHSCKHTWIDYSKFEKLKLDNSGRGERTH